MKDPLERNISETIDFDSVIFDNILMFKKDLKRNAWKDIAELSDEKSIFDLDMINQSGNGKILPKIEAKHCGDSLLAK